MRKAPIWRIVFSRNSACPFLILKSVNFAWKWLTFWEVEVRTFYYVDSVGFFMMNAACEPVDKKYASGQFGEKWIVTRVKVEAVVGTNLFRDERDARRILIKLLLTKIFDLQEDYNDLRMRGFVWVNTPEAQRLAELKNQIIEFQRMLCEVQAEWSENLVEDRIGSLRVC
jgi:hypothetical protein